MYVEDPGAVYGCFNCGEIMGEFTIATNGHYICSCCEHPSIITLRTALDTMIELQRRGHVFESDYYDDEIAIEIDPEDEDNELDAE